MGRRFYDGLNDVTPLDLLFFQPLQSEVTEGFKECGDPIKQEFYHIHIERV